MKKFLLFTLMLCIVAISCSETDDSYISIDKQIEMKITDPDFQVIDITSLNSQVLLSEWNETLRSGEDIAMTSSGILLEMKYVRVVQLKDGTYRLFGFTTEVVGGKELITSTSARTDFVNLNQKNLFVLTSSSSRSEGRTITCSNCTLSGEAGIGKCSPRFTEAGDPYCTSCQIINGAEECEKSETAEF